MREAVSPRVRFTVFDRDRFTCRYCGRSAPAVQLELDHIVPVAAGGGNDEGNLVTSCFDCNRGKRDKPLVTELIPANGYEQRSDTPERQSAWRPVRHDDVVALVEYWTDNLAYEYFRSLPGKLRELLRAYEFSAITEAMQAAYYEMQPQTYPIQELNALTKRAIRFVGRLLAQNSMAGVFSAGR